MARKSSYQLLLETILGSQVIRYYPILSEYLGGALPALLMSQLLYWDGKDFKGKSKDGWFWVGVSDMQRQTGLTPDNQRTARKHLQKRGVCEMKLRGVPRRWHYRPNLEALGELIGSLVANTDQRSLETPIVIEGEPEATFEANPDQLKRNEEITKNIITEKDNINIYSDELNNSFVLSLSLVTGLDEKLNRKKLSAFGEELHEAGYSPDLVKKIYSGWGVWFTEDWRGEKGQTPNLKNITETIQALHMELIASSAPRPGSDRAKEGEYDAITY